MIGNVAVHVLVADHVAGPDHEGRAELLRPFAEPVLSLPGRGCLEDPGRRLRSGELVPAPVAKRCDLRRVAVFIEEHREVDLLVIDEGARVAGVSGADRNDLRTLLIDLLVMPTQLRSVVPAMQSAEVAQEDQHDGSLGPVVAEAMLIAVGIFQHEAGQGFEIHARQDSGAQASSAANTSSSGAWSTVVWSMCS